MEALVDAVNIYMFNKSKQYHPYWVILGELKFRLFNWVTHLLLS